MVRCPRCTCGHVHGSSSSRGRESGSSKSGTTTSKAAVSPGLSPKYAALLKGVELVPNDSNANACRVRDRTGWPVLSGYAITRGDGERYACALHFWNTTLAGRWIDATPQSSSSSSTGTGTESRPLRVLVESHAAPSVPPPFELPAPQFARGSKAPLLIHAVEGLCNRLRAVLSYRVACHKHGRQLLVIWRPDAPCPARFLDLFLPIPGVVFLDSPPDGQPLDGVLRTMDYHSAVKGKAEEEAHCYASLEPTPSLRARIEAQLAENGPRFRAIHVRRTDHVNNHLVPCHRADAEFEAFADGRDENVALYAATDNATSQRHYLERYGDACKVHRRIQPTSALRQTALCDACVDIFTCAAATDGFLGSHGSSFSETIRRVRVAHGLGPP
jgi:hypothetical protein